VAQRAVSVVEGPSPLLVGALASYVAVALVAIFLARRVHPAAVLALLLAPAINVYGTLSNIQWVLAVYLVGMLVATPPTSGRGRLGDAIGIFVCGLTGPFSLLLLPLYAVRAINPVWRWHLVVLAIAAAIQIAALTTSFRAPGSDHDTVAIMGARVGLPIILIVIAGSRLRWTWSLGALYVAVLIPVLGINGTGIPTADLVGRMGERYFYLPWVVGIGMAILAALDILEHARVDRDQTTSHSSPWL